MKNHIKQFKLYLKSFAGALDDLGAINTWIWIVSFVLPIYLYDPQESLITWNIISLLSTVAFGAYFAFFYMHLLPKNHRRISMQAYFGRRSMDIGLLVSFVIMDLISKSNSGNPNERNRSEEELRTMCSKIDPNQQFSSHFIRNKSFDNFYEYFQHTARRINELVGKHLQFSDVLKSNQIEILLEIEKDTSSALTQGIAFANKTRRGDEFVDTIAEPYGTLLFRLREKSMELLESFDLANSIT